MTQLGQRLRTLREERHLTQQELAVKAELAVPTVTRLETGHTTGRPGRGASTRTLAKLARALDVPMSALFEFDGDTDDDVEPTARPA
jgi:transcriptional regulator with XRE-family HTH domain